MSKSQIARQKRNNSWHKIMYDNYLASTTIGSKRFVEIADKEAKFLSSVLGLTEGDRILDVPCGTGRHSRVFASLGYHVTGIDLNQYCLNLAKASCKGLKVTLQRGDMAKLSKYRDKFYAVVNLFTSFGYFATDTENEKVLRELITPLRSGGRIAIHTVNRDWLLKVFRPVDWSETNDKLIVEARKYDPATKYNESKTVIVDKKTRKAQFYYHRVRLYSKDEMIKLMKSCGLQQVKVIGNFEGAPFKKFASTHPIYIGTKV